MTPVPLLYIRQPHRGFYTVRDKPYTIIRHGTPCWWTAMDSGVVVAEGPKKYDLTVRLSHYDADKTSGTLKHPFYYGVRRGSLREDYL